jgi:hypothetical protein
MNMKTVIIRERISEVQSRRADVLTAVSKLTAPLLGLLVSVYVLGAFTLLQSVNTLKAE